MEKMSDTLKTNNFNEYYKSLGLIQRREFRKDICSCCDIEYHTFLRRLHADNWSPLERIAIQKLINKSNYEEH